MVITRETIDAFIREYETLMPVNKAAQGSYLRAMSPVVVPTISLNAYDPDADPIPVSASVNIPFGPFGEVSALECGHATYTMVATKTLLFTFAAVPAGKIHVYRHLVVDNGSAGVEDFYTQITDGGIAGYYIKSVFEGVGATDQQDIMSKRGNATAQDDQIPLGDLIVLPGQILIVRSDTTIAAATLMKLSFMRLVYDTALTRTDSSADCVGSEL